MNTQYKEEIQNILIAEDDHDDFELLAEAIQELSLKVVLTRAENGDILMRILHENIPDLLFLDIVMPCKDGKHCLQEIRSDRKFDELPIIVYSSRSDLATLEFCYRKGTNMYVLKPHTYKELVTILEKIFAVNWKQMRYYPTFSNFVLNPNTRWLR